MTNVSLVHCNSYSDVEEAIRKSISLVNFRIKKGSKVLLVPNLLRPKGPEHCITTHPSVVQAVIRILKERDCTVFVGASPGMHDPLVTAKASGILDVCRKEGASFVAFKYRKTYFLRNGLYMKKLTLTNMLERVDCVVNLPKMKTHVMMRNTLAVKNTFGLVVGLHKGQLHLNIADKGNFAKMLIDINNHVKPVLNVMDGVMAMEGNGPGSGTPINSGIISASTDSVAMDIVLSTVMGFDLDENFTNSAGLLTRKKDFVSNISIVGDKINIVPFKRAEDKPLTFVLPRSVARIIGKITTSGEVINH